jgi:hypothetical protein
MKISLPPPTPGSEFNSKFDVLNRKSIADGLTNLVKVVDEPITCSVDGSWGWGKTTFLRMWETDLKRVGIPVVFFDAYRNDYQSDPFIALTAAILSAAEKPEGAAKTAVKAVAKEGGKVAKLLLRGGFRVGLKVMTLGVLNGTEFEGLAEEIASELQDATDGYIDDAIASSKAEQDQFAAFRDALENLPGALAKEIDGKSPPLVVIIDELDRCRPDFALQLLERVKYFFHAPNVHFFFGVNLSELRHAVKVRYGLETHANAYLQKFFAINIDLPLGRTFHGESDIVKFVNYCQTQLNISSDNPKINESIRYSKEFIAEFARSNRLSLRDIERVMSAFALSMAFVQNSNLLFPPIIAGLCCIKQLHPDLFRKAKNKTLTIEELDKCLFPHLIQDDPSAVADIPFARDWWRFCIDPSADDEIVNRYNRALFEFNIRRFDIVSFLAQNVIERLSRT